MIITTFKIYGKTFVENSEKMCLQNVAFFFLGLSLLLYSCLKDNYDIKRSHVYLNNQRKKARSLFALFHFETPRNSKIAKSSV